MQAEKQRITSHTTRPRGNEGDQKVTKYKSQKQKAKSKKQLCWFPGSADGPTSQSYIFSHTCPNWMIPKPKESLGCLVSGKCSWRSKLPAVGKLWPRKGTLLQLNPVLPPLDFRPLWPLCWWDNLELIGYPQSAFKMDPKNEKDRLPSPFHDRENGFTKPGIFWAFWTDYIPWHEMQPWRGKWPPNWLKLVLMES